LPALARSISPISLAAAWLTYVAQLAGATCHIPWES
jgi:hypothetical protein